MTSGIIFLMYHELGYPSRPLCCPDPGYVRYVVTASNFEAQMQFLSSGGWRGLSVSQALNFPAYSATAITFDDGCATDLQVAVPILRRLGFGATFYITPGFLGRPGYMSTAQVRELCNLGFEVGCHSMTHPHLTDIDPDALRRETFEAKRQLELIAGKPIEHFSCPGGRYNQRVAGMVREAGFRTMATSRIQANTPATDPFALGRVVVMRGTDAKTFAGLCRGTLLWKLHLRKSATDLAKQALGNALYDRVRTGLLRAS